MGLGPRRDEKRGSWVVKADEAILKCMRFFVLMLAC